MKNKTIVLYDSAEANAKELAEDLARKIQRAGHGETVPYTWAELGLFTRGQVRVVTVADGGSNE